MNVKKTGSLNPAKAISTSPVDLSASSNPTTLTSTESISSIIENYTSLNPNNPSFSGSSTSAPNTNGSYDGSLGEEKLTFTVTKPGNVGGPYTGALGLFPVDLEIEVRKSDGTLTDTIEFSEDDDPDVAHTLSMGFSIAFSTGSLELGDSFSIDVSESDVGTANPQRSFNKRGGDDANLDPGFNIVDGSFLLNGTSVTVNASDSIDDVTQRITQSAAGVPAQYDLTSDRIELTQKTSGSGGQIAFSNDTSGFLAATKLSGATSLQGTDDSLNTKIQSVSELSGISSGSFTINGISLSIDIGNDSLQDVIDRINESEANANATYSNGFLSLYVNTVDIGLQLQDGDTGFFTALSLAPGDYESENSNRTSSLRSGAQSLQKQFDTLNKRLTDLFSAEADSTTNAEAKAVRESLKTSVLAALNNTLNLEADDAESNGVIDTQLGITFDFQESANTVVEIDHEKLLTSLRKNPRRVMKLLFQEEDGSKKSGLLESLNKQLLLTQKSLAQTLGLSSGLNLQSFA